MKTPTILAVLILSASMKMACGAESASIDTGVSDIGLPQIVQPLPGQLIGPLPGQIVKPLTGQLVPLLPNQIVHALPGQIISSLPGQIVQPLPGQLMVKKLVVGIKPSAKNMTM